VYLSPYFEGNYFSASEAASSKATTDYGGFVKDLLEEVGSPAGGKLCHIVGRVIEKIYKVNRKGPWRKPVTT